MVVEEVITSWRRVASTHDLQNLLQQGPVPFDGKPQQAGTPNVATAHHRLWGLAMVVGSGVSLAITAGVVVIKLLPEMPPGWARTVQQDWYYCSVIPALLPVTLTAVAVNWFCLKLFKHNS